jgi:hypothetical protein
MKTNKAYGEIPKKNFRWLIATGISAANDEGYDVSMLNYECLDKIDAILKKIKKNVSRLPETQKNDIIQGAAIEYASIIIRIIENETESDGKWYYHHEGFGEDTFPYVIGDATLFPYIWALKTIQEPKSNSVKSKFDQLVSIPGMP